MDRLQSFNRRGGTFETSPFRGFGEVSIAPLWPEWTANPPIVRTGTALATSYLTSGVAAHSAPRTGRGGARNRADRESHELRSAQIANLKAAEGHSQKIGLTFTRMISIHWQAAGLPLEAMPQATGRFLDLLTKALKRHGSRTAWIWNGETFAKSEESSTGMCRGFAGGAWDLPTYVSAVVKNDSKAQ